MSTSGTPVLAAKAAVVTGAAQGIGERIAWTLARAGAALTLIDREHELLGQAVGRLVSAGHCAVGVTAELGELSAKARDGKLGPSDMQGGTFTISSLGGIGGTSFTPIVNAPEVAILGVTRSAMKPVWDGAAFVPRLMVPLSLSYDHRVIDGAAAARFTARLVTVLTDLRRALL